MSDVVNIDEVGFHFDTAVFFGGGGGGGGGGDPVMGGDLHGFASAAHINDGAIIPSMLAGSTVALFDAAGVAAALVAQEVIDRNAAITVETINRVNAAATEQATRIAAETAEATARAAADALLIPLTQKAAALGVATLDGSGKVPSAQLPPLTVGTSHVVNSQAEMLALTAAVGDLAIRADLSPVQTYILTAEPPSVLGNWQQLSPSASAVTSVNGRVGAVVGVAEQADLNTEISNRTAAVSAEASTRAAADSAEAASRAAAVSSEASARTAADALLIPLTQKGSINGVASLDSSGKVPSGQLPPIGVGAVSFAMLDSSVTTAFISSAAGSVTLTQLSAGVVNSFVLRSTVTTKGDLIVGTGAGAVTRLPAGPDGSLLLADSTTASGLRFGSGPGEVNALDAGAKADGLVLTDITILGGSLNQFHSTQAALTSANIGQSVVVDGANPSDPNGVLTATVTAVVAAVATISPAATAAVANAKGAIGTDNTGAFQFAIALGRTLGIGVRIPGAPKGYLVLNHFFNTQVDPGPGFRLHGDSDGQTVLIHGFDGPMITGGGTPHSTVALHPPEVALMPGPQHPGVGPAKAGPVGVGPTYSAVAGTTTVNVVSTAGLVEGTWIRLRDTSQTFGYDQNRSAFSCVGEVHRVKSVTNSTQLEVRGRLDFNYTTAGTIQVLGMMDSVQVTDLQVRNACPTTFTTAQQFFAMNYVTNGRLSRLRFRDMDGECVRLGPGFDFDVDNLIGNDLRNDPAGNTPYLIFIVADSKHINIQGVRCRYGRHAVSVGGTAGVGPPSDVNVSDGIATEMTATAWDSHPSSLRVTYDNCVAHNCESYGYQIRGYDSTVYNPTVSRCSVGVNFDGGGDRNWLRGGRIMDCDTGVNIQDCNAISIRDTVIERPANIGVNFTDQNAAPGRIVDFELDNVTVTGVPAVATLRFNHWENTYNVGRVSCPDAPDMVIGRLVTTVDSAATIDLPVLADLVELTGTNPITGIVPQPEQYGRQVSIRAQTPSGLNPITINEGPTLRLGGGPFAANDGAILTVQAELDHWFEVSRSGSSWSGVFPDSTDAGAWVVNIEPGSRFAQLQDQNGNPEIQLGSGPPFVPPGVFGYDPIAGQFSTFLYVDPNDRKRWSLNDHSTIGHSQPGVLPADLTTVEQTIAGVATDISKRSGLFGVAASRTGLVVEVAVGDSIPRGDGVPSGRLGVDDWLTNVSNAYNRALQLPDSGLGAIMPFYDDGVIYGNLQMSNMSAATAVAGPSVGLPSAQISTNGNVMGDTARTYRRLLLVYRSTTTMQVSEDGGSTFTSNIPSSGGAYAIWTGPDHGLAAAHDFQVKQTGTGTVTLDLAIPLMGDGGSGHVLINLCKGGTTTADWIATRDWETIVTLFGASAVTIGAMGNDAFAGTTLATVRANQTTLVQRAYAANPLTEVVLLGEYHPSKPTAGKTNPISEATWGIIDPNIGWVASTQRVAMSTGATFVDLHRWIGDVSEGGADVRGVTMDKGLHCGTNSNSVFQSGASSHQNGQMVMAEAYLRVRPPAAVRGLQSGSFLGGLVRFDDAAGNGSGRVGVYAPGTEKVPRVGIGWLADLSTPVVAFSDGTTIQAVMRPQGNDTIIVQNALGVVGKTGTNTASYYAGGTHNGAPTSGTHLLNEFVIDNVGAIWICTAAGTPGTWVSVGSVPGASTVTSSMIVDGTIVNADINASAAIAWSKIATSGAVTSSDIADGTIVNADVNASAAIAWSKIATSGAVTSSDIADGTIVNADINASAAIAWSKIATSGAVTSSDIADGTIVDADINASAAIAFSKLAAPTSALSWTSATSLNIGDGTATDGSIKMAAGNIGFPFTGISVTANSADTRGLFEALNTNGVGGWGLGPGGSSATDTGYSRTGTAAGTATGAWTFSSAATFSAGATMSGNLTMGDTKNIVINTSTGTKIGTATGQKIGFFNATPVIQPASADQAAAPAGGTGTAAGGWDTAGHRDSAILLINAMRTALVNLGLIKGSA